MLRHLTEGETYRLFRGGGKEGHTANPVTTSGKFTMGGGATNLDATSSHCNRIFIYLLIFLVLLVDSGASFRQRADIPAELKCVPDLTTGKMFLQVKVRKEASVLVLFG